MAAASSNANTSLDTEVVVDSPVLRLRGLPWDATEEQLKAFFQDLNMKEIIWTFTHRNRPSGEAFVVFNSVADARTGLSRDKQVLGKRYIEVFASTLQQAESAREHKRSEGGGKAHHAAPNGSTGNNNNNSNNNNNNNNSNNNTGGGSDGANINNNNKNEKDGSGSRGKSAPSGGAGSTGVAGGAAAGEIVVNDCVVMMYGLPYTVTMDEIEDFFQGYNFVPGSVEIDVDSAGRAIGTGQITFRKAKDAQRAIAERNRKFIGKRYVNLHQNYQKKRHQQMLAQQQLLQQEKGGGAGGAGGAGHREYREHREHRDHRDHREHREHRETNNQPQQHSEKPQSVSPRQQSPRQPGGKKE